MHHSFVLTEPLGFVAPISPLQTLCDFNMSRRSVDFSGSQTQRHPLERTSSRDHSTPRSAGHGGFPDSPTKTSHKRARSSSTASTHTNADRSRHQDRSTWPVGPPPAPLQRTSSNLQRSPLTSGRNQSQTNLPLHRSPSNSPTTPSNIQRTHSTQSSPTLTRRHSRSSHLSRPILFYHKHEPHYGFTNFSNHGVKYQHKTYPTSEHLFQSLKVRTLFQPDLQAHLIPPS